MDIKTIADLAKLADLCRKKGIKTLKVSADGLEFELTEKPQGKKRAKTSQDDKVETDNQYSDEDALFWSSSQIPEVNN
jgi:hypothetical protein